MKKRYVYLMESTKTGQFKIGVSKDPDVRKKTLETGHGGPLNIRYSFHTEYPFAVEAQLHQYFENQRKEGEFFELSIDDTERFIYLCSLYDNCLTKQNEYLM